MQLHKVHIERMSHKAGWSKHRRVASEFGAGSWWPEGGRRRCDVPSTFHRFPLLLPQQRLIEHTAPRSLSAISIALAHSSAPKNATQITFCKFTCSGSLFSTENRVSPPLHLKDLIHSLAHRYTCTHAPHVHLRAPCAAPRITYAPPRITRCIHACTPARHAPHHAPRITYAPPRTTRCIHACHPARYALHPRMHPCASRAASTHAPPRVTRCTTHQICTPARHALHHASHMHPHTPRAATNQYCSPQHGSNSRHTNFPTIKVGASGAQLLPTRASEANSKRR